MAASATMIASQMGRVKLELELEDELVALLSATPQPLPSVAREMIVLELYRRRLVSIGKAAEWLEMQPFDFVRHASDLGLRKEEE